MARKKKVYLDLTNIQEFMEGFIGLIIVRYTAYSGKAKEFEGAVGKIITGTSTHQGKLTVTLSDLSGKYAGSLEISPTETGEFLEKNDSEEPTWQAKYRITFYGGNCIEYIDISEKSKINFV